MTAFLTFAKFLVCVAVAGVVVVAIIFALCVIALILKGTVEAFKSHDDDNSDKENK